ncbi:hypothetical protein BRD13_03280 [Halobacteriales archaeon SW_5_70_135]|nr:MAG: hypothetical protein BRD13_03280 [Halobacteriales archaeon SW_5_70_135]
MACPRCGGRLERYELSDRVEAACVDCGYVGVPVDHGSERARQESWTAAMERVEGRFDGATATAVGPAPPPLPDEGDGDPQPRTVRTDTGTASVVTADTTGPADGSEATADGATTDHGDEGENGATDDTEDATTEREGEDGGGAADGADGETPNGEESEGEREGEEEGESGNENETESGTDAADGTLDRGD